MRCTCRWWSSSRLLAAAADSADSAGHSPAAGRMPSSATSDRRRVSLLKSFAISFSALSFWRRKTGFFNSASAGESGQQEKSRRCGRRRAHRHRLRSALRTAPRSASLWLPGPRLVSGGEVGRGRGAALWAVTFRNTAPVVTVRFRARSSISSVTSFAWLWRADSNLQHRRESRASGRDSVFTSPRTRGRTRAPRAQGP